MKNLEKLQEIEKRHQELEQQLSDPEIIANQGQYQKIAKEFADIAPAVEAFRAYNNANNQIEELTTLLKEKHDKEFEELAKSEIVDLEAKKSECEEKLNDILNPKKQVKDRDVMLEIRAGTGGLEASLFAMDLYRMYTKYAALKGWKIDPINCHESEAGGIKEVVFSVSGKGASSRLKWESGAHRVQRVPSTEASGRIHTSAATVVVLFEPEEVELNLDPKDIKVDIFRSSGPGGQSVNTTDSAVRMTYLPMNLVVICQDERSQLKNKYKAIRVLRARILDQKERENSAKEARERKSKVGTGDRSEKIRTYNFPDRRITDHRIGFTTYRLPNVLDGDLDELTDALIKAENEETLV